MGSRPLRAVRSESENGKKSKTLLVARRSSPEESAAQIVVLDPSDDASSSKPLVLETGAFTGFGRIAVAGKGNDGIKLAVVAAQPTAPAALVEASLNLTSSSSLSWSVVAKSSDLQGIEGFVSTPKVVKFPTGKEKKEFAYL